MHDARGVSLPEAQEALEEAAAAANALLTPEEKAAARHQLFNPQEAFLQLSGELKKVPPGPNVPSYRLSYHSCTA